jgi:hypothetical protein
MTTLDTLGSGLCKETYDHIQIREKTTFLNSYI